MLPAVALFVAGCGKSDPTSGGDDNKGGGGQVKGGELKAYKGEGSGALKGKVTLAGGKPQRKPLDIPSNNPDKDYCLKGSPDEISEQTWKVSDAGGVENVVVWVKEPEGTYFDLSDSQKKPERETIKIDQPFCAFVPHVEVLFADYYDPKTKKMVPSGQKLQVANSAEKTHNTNWNPSSPLNRGDNKLLNPKTPPMDVPLKSGGKPGSYDHTTFKCQIHPWMNAHVLAFGHPFAAKTDKDGSFEIKNVPAGAQDLEVMYWHESMDKPQSLGKVKVETGGTTKNIELKK